MMKSKKKKLFLPMMIAVMLLINIISPLSVSLTHATNSELELEWSMDKENVNANEEVEITVSLKNYDNIDISEIKGMQIDVLLDTNLVEFVASSVNVMATASVGDILSATYNGTNKKVIFMYASLNVESVYFSRENTNLFSFKVKAKSDITTDSIANFTCTQFAVTTVNGNRKIDVNNNPSINILVEQPKITLNGSSATGADYTSDVTIAFDKGTATLMKEGGTLINIPSGYVANTNGEYTLTVTDAVGNTKTVSFTIDLVVDSITMKTTPTKVNYAVGTTLDTNGGVLEVIYANGRKADVNLTVAMCDVVNVGNTLGSKTVTVIYGGKTSSFDITVVDKTIVSIEVLTTPDQVIYKEGLGINVAGGKIKVNYDNGTFEEKDMTSAMVSGYNAYLLGKQTLTVTYEGKTTSFEVSVIEKSIDRIEITNAPTTTQYIEGQSFDKTGMVVTAYYDNGANEVIEDYSVPSAQLVLGQNSVTIIYLDKSTTTPVSVVAKQITGISIATQPAKTAYIEGNTFDKAGMVVVVNYDNGLNEEITTYEVETTPLIVGQSQVTVAYQGYTANATITVREKAVESIAIKTVPTKLTYLEGSNLDVSGGRITLLYDNGTEDTINISSDMISGYDPDISGVQIVAVTHAGKTTMFEVTVIAKKATSISIIQEPRKTEYIEGQDLDTTDGIIHVVYDNGTEEDLEMTTEMISNYNKDKIGDQIITVTYQDQTDTFKVNIREKVLVSISIRTSSAKTVYLEGQSLDLTDVVIVALYDNGLTTDIPVTDKMLSDYNMHEVGKQTLTVTFGNYEVDFVVEILSREAVNDLIAKINALDLNQLKATDKEAIYGLKAIYDGLSQVEKEAVTNIDKLEYAITKVDALENGTEVPEYNPPKSGDSMSVVLPLIGMIASSGMIIIFERKRRILNKLKKIGSLFCCLFLVLSMVNKPTLAFELDVVSKSMIDEENKVEQLVSDFRSVGSNSLITYSNYVVDGTILVSYTGKEQNVVIPSDLGITEIANAAFIGNYVNSVMIPNGVKNIGDSAFSNCSNLTDINVDGDNTEYSSIDGVLFNKDKTTLVSYPVGKIQSDYTIPNSVANIRDFAFTGNYVKSVMIPDGVKNIGNSAFSNCSNLTDINVDGDNTEYSSIDGVLFNKDKTTLISYPVGKTQSDYTIPNSVANIGDFAFTFSNLKRITIPESVTSIGDYGFASCYNLMSISIPSSVTSIGNFAFYGCKRINNITIPNSVISIGKNAFNECLELTNIIIPSSVTTIGFGAFVNCFSLRDISVENGNTEYSSVDGVLFNKDKTILIDYPSGKGQTAYIIPNSVTSIGEYAFYYCQSLRSIMIPEGVESIGDSAFSSCSNLTSINIPSSVTSIGNFAFSHCSNLTSINIPSSVTSIGSWAFAYCRGLTNIVIPNSVTSIGDLAFYNCENLNSIIIPKGVESIGDSAFSNCSRFLVISCYFNSCAHSYSIKNGIRYEIIGALIDTYHGVVITADDDVLEGDIALLVDKLTSFDNTKLTIKLLKENNIYQPNGTVTVYIPIPNGYSIENSKVYRIEENGTKTLLETTFENGYLGFKTDCLSSYVVTEKNLVQKGDVNGDEDINIFDIMEIRDYIFGEKELTKGALEAADVNSDGEINIFDIMEIRDYIFGNN